MVNHQSLIEVGCFCFPLLLDNHVSYPPGVINEKTILPSEILLLRLTSLFDDVIGCVCDFLIVHLTIPSPTFFPKVFGAYTLRLANASQKCPTPHLSGSESLRSSLHSLFGPS